MFPTIIAARYNTVIAMILCPYLVNVSSHVPPTCPFHHCTHCACVQMQHTFKEVRQMSRLIYYALNYLHNKRSVISWQIVEVVSPAIRL